VSVFRRVMLNQRWYVEGGKQAQKIFQNRNHKLYFLTDRLTVI